MEENIQEEMEEKKSEKDLKKRLEEKVDEIIMQIVDDGIDGSNLETLGELVDIHKDLANEDYWKVKKEVMQMNYRGYDEEYGARRRDSRGRYMARGRKYRTQEPMEEMYEHYQAYSEGKEGYGHDHKTTMKALEYMLESAVDFFEMLKEEANSPEELQMIKHYSKKISEML